MGVQFGLTKKEIFKGEDEVEFLASCHPINGLSGFSKWYQRVIGNQLKPFHKEWVGPLVNREVKRAAIAAPAGSGKSELFALGLPSWYMWYNVSPMPPWEGLIVSTSEPQSKKLLQRFKNLLNNNALLQDLRPGTRDKTWSTTEVQLNNDTWFAVKPLNENVRSYHPDYIVADEVSAYDKVPDGRRIYREYVSSRIGAKAGILIAISTPSDEDDFLAELQGKEIYHSVTTHALVNEHGEPDINGESIWPDHPTGLYSKRSLMEKLSEIGPRAFALQYLCDTTMLIDDEDSPFPASLLVRCSDKGLGFEHERDPEAEYIAAYDPAFSVGGDYNAIIIAKIKDKKCIIIGIQRYKGDPDEAISILAELNKKFKFNKVIIDTNSGGWKVLRDASKLNIPVVSFPFSSQARVAAIHSTISRLNVGDIIFPMSEEIGNTAKMVELLFRELTRIKRDKTKMGMITYTTHTKHDDCLKEGTLIKTIDGYKPIEDVKVGDFVFTHKGRYKQVIKSLKKPFDGLFYNTKFTSQLPLELSYNHPLYCASRDYSGGKRNDYAKRQWVLPEDWKKSYRQVSVVESLGKNEKVALSENMFYENHKLSTNIKLKELRLDKRFAKFLGLFLAEGNCSDTGWYIMTLAFNRKHKKLINEMKKYLISIGIAVKGKIDGSKQGGYNLRFSSKLLHYIMKECYDKNKEKQLPFYARFLGKDLKYVLEYWLKGDGWLRPKSKDCVTQHYIGASVSKSLAISMRDVALSVGKYASIQKVKRHRYSVKTKDQYWVKIYDSWPRFASLKRLSDFEVGARLHKNEYTTEQYNGFVYNLQVEDDESFVADGIVVHNCAMCFIMLGQGLPEFNDDDSILDSRARRGALRGKRSPRRGFGSRI